MIGPICVQWRIQRRNLKVLLPCFLPSALDATDWVPFFFLTPSVATLNDHLRVCQVTLAMHALSEAFPSLLVTLIVASELVTLVMADVALW